MKTIQLTISIIMIIFCSWNISAKNVSKKSKIISMNGITPYGMEIKEKKKIIRRRNFQVEVIYSKMLSDDIMGKYDKRFFEELISQIRKWVNANRLPRSKVKIIISNCRFCKIGYCKIKNKKEISIVSYREDKKDKTISIKREDIINKNKYIIITKKAVLKIFNK